MGEYVLSTNTCSRVVVQTNSKTRNISYLLSSDFNLQKGNINILLFPSLTVC